MYIQGIEFATCICRKKTIIVVCGVSDIRMTVYPHSPLESWAESMTPPRNIIIKFNAETTLHAAYMNILHNGFSQLVQVCSRNESDNRILPVQEHT